MSHRSRPTPVGAERPLASISLDLDNLWSYMMIHGDAGWDAYPSYLDPLSEIVSGWIRRHALRLTIFVVGRDAALERNEAALLRLAEGDQEIGNHSFSHEPWFHTYGRDTIVREIEEAERHIERVVGRRPRGFRGPGFSLSRETLSVLRERGYLYDASTFPTIIGPLARAYYFWNAGDLSPEERRRRDRLFGGVAEALRPLHPYRVTGLGGGQDELLEIPVSTMPFLRVPFHMSYLGYIAMRSVTAARAWLRAALQLCRRAGIEPSFLFHPLDFLGGDRVPELAFFPGMEMTTGRKLELLDDVIGILKEQFDLVPVEDHARAVSRRGGVPSRSFS